MLSCQSEGGLGCTCLASDQLCLSSVVKCHRQGAVSQLQHLLVSAYNSVSIEAVLRMLTCALLKVAEAARGGGVSGLRFADTAMLGEQ